MNKAINAFLVWSRWSAEAAMLVIAAVFLGLVIEQQISSQAVSEVYVYKLQPAEQTLDNQNFYIYDDPRYSSYADYQAVQKHSHFTQK